MFSKERPKYQLLIEDEIEALLRRLKTNHESEEYVKTLSHVERLHDMLDKKSTVVSKDTWVSVGANLLGILMIIKHEHVNVISSKAMSFVPRLK